MTRERGGESSCLHDTNLSESTRCYTSHMYPSFGTDTVTSGVTTGKSLRVKILRTIGHGSQ